MDRMNDLQLNVQNLADAGIINLDVSLGTLVKSGALSGLDPWDVWCGNGWILRRKGSLPAGINEIEKIREVVQQELQSFR